MNTQSMTVAPIYGFREEGCRCQSCFVDNLQMQVLENKFVDYKYTLYIPYVNKTISANELFNIFENLGKVQRLEVVPKLKLETGAEYNIVFVYFTEWFNTELNTEIVETLGSADAQFQLFYTSVSNTEKYLNLKYNISPLAKIPLPKHYDLMLCVNKNISFEYLNQVITALDIGQVNSIFVNTKDTHTNIDNYLWKGINPSIWVDCFDTPDKLHHNVQISFSWWFHTEQAFLFQENLLKNGSIQIPVDLHTIFTFYLFRALVPDQNPYIYYP
jgi:hypothetical protein